MNEEEKALLRVVQENVDDLVTKLTKMNDVMMRALKEIDYNCRGIVSDLGFHHWAKKDLARACVMTCDNALEKLEKIMGLDCEGGAPKPEAAFTVCPRCKGKGYIVDYGIDPYESRCDTCSGTGKVAKGDRDG